MSEHSDQERLDARIREHYESIPPSERRLADLLLTFPGDITDYSATELCEKAQTSRAAATRFFSRLGYKDYNDARRQAREAKKWGAPLYQSTGNPPHVQNQEHLNQDVSEHINYEQTNLQRTLEGLDSSTLRAVVSAVCSSKRVLIVGYRNNHFLANYFYHQLSLLRENVSLHPQANQSMAEELFDLNSDDMVIVFGFRRRTPILEKVVTLANQRKSRTLLISDPTSAALQKQVTWKINCIVHSTSAFDSYTSIMSILSLLVNSVMAESPGAIERLREIESAHELLGELSVIS